MIWGFVIALISLLLFGVTARKYALLKAHLRSDENNRARIDVDALNAEIEKRKIIEAELRAAKDAAERGNRAKTQFLANMSHELRTPLNAIIGFAEVIAGELSGPLGTPIYKEYAQDIASGGKQLFEILSNILEMARIEAGKAGISESDFQLKETFNSAVRTCLARAAQGQRVEINCEASVGLHADERMIRQVLVALISNALKFSDSGGRVTVDVHATATGLDILVRDEGAGIPPDKRDEVLEPFNQLEDVLTRRTGGLGLGLPLAHAFVKLHGGTLAIEHNLGRGSVTSVHLPTARLITLPQNGLLAAG